MSKRKPPTRPVFYSEQVVSWVDPDLKRQVPDLAKQDGYGKVSDWIRNLIRDARKRLLGR